MTTEVKPEDFALVIVFLLNGALIALNVKSLQMQLFNVSCTALAIFLLFYLQ